MAQVRFYERVVITKKADGSEHKEPLLHFYHERAGYDSLATEAHKVQYHNEYKHYLENKDKTPVEEAAPIPVAAERIASEPDGKLPEEPVKKGRGKGKKASE